jgi:hypothetical protein
MELLEVLITPTSQTVTVTCGCYYGNCLPTTADTIAESMRPLLLPLASAGTINDNDAAYCANTLLGY